MNLKRLITISIFFSSLGLAAANAQSLRNASEPAEFPPASYKGKQYVDSRGCAYVRAGIDGSVNWVPRVSRSRQHLCGLKPTPVAGATQTPARSSKVVQIELDETPAAAPAPKPKAAAPAPQPRVVEAPKPRSEPKPQAQPKQRTTQVARSPQPQAITPRAPQTRAAQPRSVAAAPKPVKPRVQAQPAQRKTVTTARAVQPSRGNTATQRTTCPNFKGISAQYAGRGPGVRCGPQTQGVGALAVTREPVKVMRAGKPVTVQKRVVRRAQQPQPKVAAAPQRRTAAKPPVVKRDSKTGAINAPANTRVVPRHIYEQQQASKVTTKVPEGYRKAWDDDRLNPKRGHMTVQGIRQSDLLWTRTIPRKLYVRQTGLVVNHLFPELRYPYTSMDDQNRAMGFTTSSRSKPAAAPKAAPAAPASSGRFVQVGTYGNPANAQRAAKRIQAAGMPARIGRVTRSGKSYQVVFAGPFASNQLSKALSSARRAGFSDAFVK